MLDNTILGASFENEWQGLGWRVEAAHYNGDQTGDNSLFWIAGVDYQFNNGTLFATEWYNNNRGANDETAVATLQTDAWVQYGLQQQLSRRVLALMFDQDLTPLWHGSYTLLTSVLHEPDTSMVGIWTYANECDCAIAFLFLKSSTEETCYEI